MAAGATEGTSLGEEPGAGPPPPPPAGWLSELSDELQDQLEELEVPTNLDIGPPPPAAASATSRRDSSLSIVR